MMKRYYYKKGLALALSALLVAEPLSVVTSSAKVYAQDMAAETTDETEVSSVELSEENFPDSVFLEYLKETFDEDGDGWIDKSAVTELDVNSMNIHDLSGIEYFDNLKYLDCSDNFWLNHKFCVMPDSCHSFPYSCQRV